MAVLDLRVFDEDNEILRIRIMFTLLFVDNREGLYPYSLDRIRRRKTRKYAIRKNIKKRAEGRFPTLSRAVHVRLRRYRSEIKTKFA